jgi:hypothetical protein
MVNIIQAIDSLNLGEYCLRGIPTNESEFNQMFTKVVGKDNNGTAIESDNPDEFGVTWSELSLKLEELKNAEPIKSLRVKRNKLLSETDWWVLPDRTPTQEQLDYRQALRDITETYSSLDDVIWPVKPTE